MTDTQAVPAVDPGPPPPRPPRTEAAFFSWIRGLGIPRTRGWLGGVCAGLSVRMGIDPIIVRGIFVVVAILGFPALLVYAIAWALLPDLEGRIHLQELGRGRFDPALIPVGIMALLSLFPVVPWMWSAVFWPFTGAFGWYEPFGYGPLAWVNGFFVFLLIAGVVALVVWLVVRAVKSSRGGSVNVPRTASADAAAPGTSPVESDAYALYRPPPADGAATDSTTLASRAPLDQPRVADLDVAPAEPTVAADAPADELAEWRAKHDAWRIEHDAWRRRQAEADAAIREQARLERAEAARIFAAEVAERRRVRRATNPRASAVFVLTVMGAALVGGALMALAIGTPEIGAPAGVLVAGLIVALGMVAAGAARRRSGVLAFLTVVLVGSGVIAGFAGSTSTISWGDSWISSIGTEEQQYLQPFGSTTIQLFEVSDERYGAIVLRKGTGGTTIYVPPGTTLELQAALRDGELDFVRTDVRTGEVFSAGNVGVRRTVDGVRHYEWEVSSPGTNVRQSTIVPVRIDQLQGSVRVVVETFREEGS